MAVIEILTAAEFEVNCLSILDRIASGELERVNITQDGRRVAVVTPPPPATVRDLYGSMRGSVTIADDVDLTAPVLDEPIDAAEGIWHR
jgi:antitoxin (DNA-binding transcriptional repressor) of toxin-antitoxin stability system